MTLKLSINEILVSLSRLIGLILAVGMCRWPLRAPTSLKVYSLANLDPISVTFGQVCNFRDPNLVTFYFYELTHFLDRMKNTLLFICRTNIYW